MINNENSLFKKIMKVFINNKDLILNNWISLVEDNVKMQDDYELDSFIELSKNILNNFINYLMNEDIEAYLNTNLEITKAMAYNNMSYRNFMDAIYYFQESYISILVKNLELNDIDKCIIFVSRIYNKTLDGIREEYFNIKDSTLTAILKLSEMRDDETSKHVERAKEYAVLLSQELNLDEKFINNMKKASLLHDIGKISVRDSIMLKPGKLTDDEFEEMKKHTVVGSKTISIVMSVSDLHKEYLFMAMDIALSHHEKYDGSGYPNGLVGIEIPLSARIFAVADAYDAITSKRPYKEALSHEEAVRRILLDSNKHFDPKIIIVFERIQDKFKLINSNNNNLE